MRYEQLGRWALMTVLLIAGASPAQADHEITLFFNNFESRAVRTLPAPWQMITDGAGMDLQGVSEDFAVSGTKSLKLVGRYTHWATIQRPFKTDAPVVGSQYYIRFGADHNTSEQPPNEGETPGFFCMNAESYYGSFYGTVIFDHPSGKIKKPTPLSGVYEDLRGWSPDTWYKVRTLVNRVDHRVKVWIDGVLVWDDEIPRLLHPEGIDAIAFSAGHAGGPVYYDNVRVFLPGVQEMGALAREEIDRFINIPKLPSYVADAVGQLKGPLDEAMNHESAGDYAAAIESLRGFLTMADNLAKPRPIIRVNQLPPLTEKDHDTLTRLGGQMILQIQAYKNEP